MTTKELTLNGVVVSSPFANGSKSEHDAVFLQIGEKRYRLKRKNGNPFFDEVLQKLIGKKVALHGFLNGYFFEIVGEPEVTEAT